MKVTFNPNIGMKRKMVAPKEQPVSFARTKTKEEEQIELFSNKTKRAVFTCFCAAIAVNIIYFALCRNFKANRQKHFEQSLVDAAKARKKAIEQDKIPSLVKRRLETAKPGLQQTNARASS